MPLMYRPNKKASKIAFDIIGKPQVFDYKRSAAQKKVDKELASQETSRVR